MQATAASSLPLDLLLPAIRPTFVATWADPVASPSPPLPPAAMPPRTSRLHHLDLLLVNRAWHDTFVVLVYECLHVGASPWRPPARSSSPSTSTLATPDAPLPTFPLTLLSRSLADQLDGLITAPRRRRTSESRDDDDPPLPPRGLARTHNLRLLELPAACRDRVSIAESITALTGCGGAALWTIEVLGWELSGSDLSSFGGRNGLGATLARLVLWDVDLAGDTLRGLAAQLPGLQSFTFASRFRSNSAADDNDEDLVPDARWRLPEDVLADVVVELPRLLSLDLSVHTSECAFGRLAESLAGLEALAHLRLRGPVATPSDLEDLGTRASLGPLRARLRTLAVGRPGWLGGGGESDWHTALAKLIGSCTRLSGLVLDSESGAAPTLATPVGLRALSVGARVPAATVVGSLVWPSAATLTYLRVPLGTFATLARGWQHELGESRMPGLPSLATLKLEVEYSGSGPGLGGGGDVAVEDFAACEGLPDACGSVTSLHVISCPGGAGAPVPVSFLRRVCARLRGLRSLALGVWSVWEEAAASVEDVEAFLVVKGHDAGAYRPVIAAACDDDENNGDNVDDEGGQEGRDQTDSFLAWALDTARDEYPPAELSAVRPSLIELRLSLLEFQKPESEWERLVPVSRLVGVRLWGAAAEEFERGVDCRDGGDYDARAFQEISQLNSAWKSRRAA